MRQEPGESTHTDPILTVADVHHTQLGDGDIRMRGVIAGLFPHDVEAFDDVAGLAGRGADGIGGGAGALGHALSIRGAWFLMPVMHAWSDVMRLSPIRPDGTLGRQRGQRACRPLTYDDMPAVGARTDRRFRMRAPASRASPVPAWLAHTGTRAARPYVRKLLFHPSWIDRVPELLSRGATQALTAADTGPSGATDF